MERVALSLVGIPPDPHAFRLLDQAFPKIGMRQRNQSLRPLPGVFPFHVHDSIFGDNILDNAARCGADGARR